MLWECIAAGGTGALHKIDGIMREGNCGYIEATSQNTSKVVAKWPKDNKVKILEWSSQNPDFNPIEHLWAELKRRVRARRPTNLTQLHQLCQEEWAKLHQTYCGKLVEDYPKHLTQVKQFKGNASKC